VIARLDRAIAHSGAGVERAPIAAIPVQRLMTDDLFGA